MVRHPLAMADEPTEWDINTNIDPDFWDEIGHTRLDFPAAVCEFVDNAISATVPSSGGECRFNILVKLIRRKSSPALIELVVADDGLGIDRDTIVKQVFSLGAKSLRAGLCFPKLREHGFGLKHAIAWFVRELPMKDFTLVTGYRSSPSTPPDYYRYSGPLQTSMKLKRSSRKEWAALASPTLKARGGNDTGTRIGLSTKFDTARSGWELRKAQVDPYEIPDLHTLALFLEEELGVRYRHFLDLKAGRIIRLSVADEENGDSVNHPKTSTVPPRPIPYIQSLLAFKSKSIGSLKVSYRRGISNPDLVDPPSKTLPNRFRIYYGHSMRGQGLDVVLNGRVVDSPFYPWPDRLNNINNGLVGEIEVEGDVQTILTKDGVDWSSSSAMRRVRDEIVHADVVGPRGGQRSLESLFTTIAWSIPKSARSGAGAELLKFLSGPRTLGSPAHISRPGPKGPGRKYVYYTYLNESQRTAILKPGIEAALGVTVSSRDTWGVAGVPVLPADLVFDHGGKTVLIECKDRDTTHDDLYQVRRYWDGLVARGITPSVALIVADATRPEVKALADYFENAKFTDEKGNPLKIRFLTWRQFNIPSRIKGGTPGPAPDVKATFKVMIKMLSTI